MTKAAKFVAFFVVIEFKLLIFFLFFKRILVVLKINSSIDLSCYLKGNYENQCPNFKKQ